MNLPDIIYENSEITDRETFALMPMELKEFYLDHNGIVAFQGGIQFRGCLTSPIYLSIREIWKGDSNLFETYHEVEEQDIPIAQDAFGDHYLYRDGRIYKLSGETGELDYLHLLFKEFIAEIERNGIEFLIIEPIYDLASTGINLKPDQMMNVYPPFMMKSKRQRNFRPVSTSEQIAFLKSLYLQTKDLDEDQQIRIRIRE